MITLAFWICSLAFRCNFQSQKLKNSKKHRGLSQGWQIIWDMQNGFSMSFSISKNQKLKKTPGVKPGLADNRPNMASVSFRIFYYPERDAYAPK
jgi:hypothetical protein